MTGSYQAMFTVAAAAYVVAVLVIHALAPRLEPARLGPEEPAGRDFDE